MAVLSVEQVLSGTTLGLTSGLSDLLILEFSGRTVIYALGRVDGVLHEIELASDGSLMPVASLALAGDFAAGSEPLLGAIEVSGGESRLAIAGLSEPDGQSVTLSLTGAIGSQSSVTGLGQLTDPVGVDLASPAVISGRSGGGLDLFVDSGNGFAWSAGLDDTADRYLADLSGSTGFRVGGVDYIATASALEDGVNIVSVSIGSVSQTGALGAAEGLPINTPSDLDVVQRLDESWLVVSASGTSSISVLGVDSDGGASIADHVLDGEANFFQAASVVGVATYGDFAFVAIGGGEGGISLFTILPGGRLIHLNSFADDTATTLYRPSSIELLVSGSSLQIYVSSYWEPGLTRLSYDLSGLGAVLVADVQSTELTGTMGFDQIMGSDVSEVLSGAEGADTISDGAGEDTLSGNVGADLFVFAADGQADTILDFERGEDKLDLSGWDFLYDVSQIQWSPTTDGAVLIFGDEMIVVHASDGLTLNSGELTNEDILNVDRPPLLAINQTLVGGNGSDTLNGGYGDDTVQGAAGDDILVGKGGSDHVEGGAGYDTLDGGGDADTLKGQSEDDVIVGGAGNDLIEGGDGGDLIYGDEFDWAGV